MEKFFKLKQRGTSVGQEVSAGLTTFLAMAYIIMVNPALLAEAGIPVTAAVTSTCLGAALMTILMGIFSNRPLACASGMGVNAVVAFSLTALAGGDWRSAMAVIFLEGIVILLLVLFGLREKILDAIPASLRHAIAAGLGIFIAFIGLKNAGIIVADQSTLLTLGKFSDPAVIVGFIAIISTFILYCLHIKGEILLGIIIAVIAGIPLGVTHAPQGIVSGLDFSTFAAPFQSSDGGPIALVKVLVNPTLLMFVFSLMMSDFFDTMGSAFAIAKQGDFLDEDGNIKDIRPILTVDSIAASVGGFLGASSITTYVEASAGAAQGGRTGLTSITTGVLFFVSAFFAPLISIVSEAATTGALILVGFLMISEVTEISWDTITDGIPAFVTLLCIPLTYSIASGIGLGFISYIIVSCASGKIKDIKPLMWIVAIAFLISFLLV